MAIERLEDPGFPRILIVSWRSPKVIMAEAIRFTALLLILAFCVPRAVGQQETAEDAARLNQQVIIVSRQGKAAEAIPRAKRALEIRENNADYDTSLINLAQLYCLMGRWEEAEPLIRQELAIREKVWSKGNIGGKPR